jgi:DNA-binding FrmR family transcriptional regulator
MPSIDRLPADERAEIVNRLKRIEGQAKGIYKMVEEGRDCIAILNQVASVKAAVHALSGEMLEMFALHCLSHPEDFPSAEKAIEEMVRVVVRTGR